MADTTERALTLLGLLQAHRSWGGAELAARLRVTERTLRRDVERLRQLGYPVESVRGSGGGYQLAAGAAMPPLLVDEQEAVAIVAALRGAATGAAGGLADASLRALAKVTQVLPARLRQQAEAVTSMSVGELIGGGPELNAELLATVALACRDQVRIRFGYTAVGRPAGSRTVEPLRLVPIGRRWYLVAFDLDRADWRNFRLDRMREVEATTARFRPRKLPGGDPAAFVRAGLAGTRDAHPITARVAAPARRVTERIGRWTTVAPDGDGARVTMRFGDVGWAALALGQAGADFDLLEIADEQLADLRDWVLRLQRAVYLAERAARSRQQPGDGGASDENRTRVISLED